MKNIRFRFSLLLGLAGGLFLLWGCSPPQNSSQENETRFSVNLRRFSPTVLDGYNQCNDLRSDIEETGKLLANLTIAREKENKFFGPVVLEAAISDISIEGENNTASAVDTGVEAASDGDSLDSDEFGTNNQVTGVDEGDIVKSDGQFIYLAYGDEIVVHDLEGNILDRQTLPELTAETSSRIKAASVGMSIVEEPNDSSEGEGFDDSSEDEGFSDSSEDGTPANDTSLFYIAQESISALLFDQNRVLVVASGYNSYENLINNHTRLLLYEVASDGKLSLLEENMVQGTYQAARELDGTAHVVSLAVFDHYQLTGQLSRYNSEFQELEDDAYEQAALAKAETLLPEWRDGLMRELFANDQGKIDPEACQHIIQVSGLGIEDNDTTGDGLDLTNGQGVVNAFAQILSFDLNDGLSSLRSSGAFVPTTDVITYANTDVMILGGRSWGQFDIGQWQASSMLLAFSITTGEAVPLSVGEIEGRILNQFSIDYHEDHLRVASTVEDQWDFVDGQWKQTDPSESLVTVLQFNESQMDITGSVRGLGEGEEIYAARFLGDRAFVVTFERTDPFYTLDLSDPTLPQVVGELKIPGFSNYLHPVGEDHILAIGQDADETTGQIEGFQVALFDVSDLANPLQQYKHVVVGWSSSGAQGDHKAFRFLESRETLILPLSDATTDSYFDGFQIYKVSPSDGISVTGQITHTNTSSGSCYSGAYLSPRSLVFGERLVTVKGHAVFSHQLSDLEKQWSIDLDQNQSSGITCYPWFVID